jgi:hypothetical protein
MFLKLVWFVSDMLGLFGILPTFQISRYFLKNIEEFIVY